MHNKLSLNKESSTKKKKEKKKKREKGKEWHADSKGLFGGMKIGA